MTPLENLLFKIEATAPEDQTALIGLLQTIYAAELTGETESLLKHCEKWNINLIKKQLKELKRGKDERIT